MREGPKRVIEYTIGKDVDMKAEQEKTLQGTHLPANLFLRTMYYIADVLYGAKRTLPKVKVIEIMARYPYFAWENRAYDTITNLYASTRYTRTEETERALHLIELGREAQDNEQIHLLIIEDLMRQKGMKQGWFLSAFVPRMMAFGYYYFTRMLYRIRPAWSFDMNARFESHALHEYMRMVADNPEWEDEPVDSYYFKYYVKPKSMADLFRRIGLDERDHMYQSIEEYEIEAGKPFYWGDEQSAAPTKGD